MFGAWKICQVFTGFWYMDTWSVPLWWILFYNKYLDQFIKFFLCSTRVDVTIRYGNSMTFGVFFFIYHSKWCCTNFYRLLCWFNLIAHNFSCLCFLFQTWIFLKITWFLHFNLLVSWNRMSTLIFVPFTYIF